MFTKEPVAVEQVGKQPQSIQTPGLEPIAELVRTSPTTSQGPPDAIPTQLAASRGLTQMFGLDPRVAILTVLVDLMLFGVDSATLECVAPVGVLVAAALGFIVFKAQRHWYHDDHESALIKAMMIGLLTAIPVPLTPLIAIPAGAVGIIKAIRRK
jgi:hypothetical protein